MLVNLLSNAVKFTARGYVRVTAREVEDAVEVSVSDSGPGVASADHGKLFHYYEQVGEKHARGLKGSGIGLALTRTLVESMRETIGISSELGAGACFWARLPRASRSSEGARR